MSLERELTYTIHEQFETQNSVVCRVAGYSGNRLSQLTSDQRSQ